MPPSCRGSSIKTRIETDRHAASSKRNAKVAEVVPLKQGLKLELRKVGSASNYVVAEVVPLKQGLKQ